MYSIAHSALRLNSATARRTDCEIRLRRKLLELAGLPASSRKQTFHAPATYHPLSDVLPRARFCEEGSRELALYLHTHPRLSGISM
jgi:hypothetical protein